MPFSRIYTDYLYQEIEGTIQQFAPTYLALEISIPVPSCTSIVVPQAVAVFLVCHNVYDVDAPRAPSTHTAYSVGCRSTARARSRPGKQTR